MTQFLTLRQVFENFLDHQDLFINLLAALAWLLFEISLLSSEAFDYGTVFWWLASFLNLSSLFHAARPG